MKKKGILHNSREFKRVYDNGISKADRFLVMYVLKVEEPGIEDTRIGISVSKKVGNSVVRHRIKRLVRESVRLRKDSFIKGINIAFIIRVKAKEASFWDIDNSVNKLGKKLGIIVDNFGDSVENYDL